MLHDVRILRKKMLRPSITRMTATIENGFVWLPEAAPWLADYLAEMTAFPRGRHDDQVDSTAQALAWAKQRPASLGMLDYWRRLAEEG